MSFGRYFLRDVLFVDWLPINRVVSRLQSRFEGWRFSGGFEKIEFAKTLRLSIGEPPNEAYFAEQWQLLLPMSELIETAKQSIAAAMKEAGRGMAEFWDELLRKDRA